MKRKPFVFFFLIWLVAAWADSFKVKVTVDNASLKSEADINAKTLLKIPVDTILEAEEKKGEWYKVSLEKDGAQLAGYIHELLVEIVPEEKKEPLPAKVVAVDKNPPVTVKTGPENPDRTQIEILAEVELQLEKCRILIRDEKKYEEALNILSTLVARTSRVMDPNRRAEITVEIFLFRGLAQDGLGNGGPARKEFRNMFEVDADMARRLAKNIYDPKIVALLRQAESEYLGLVVEFTLDILSDPPGARVKADGRDLGLTPASYKSQSPKVLIEIEKDGFKPIREEVILSQAATRKEYRLETAAFTLTLQSEPAGARIFLDGTDTGKETNSELPGVLSGRHQVKLAKNCYADFETQVDIRGDEASSSVSGQLIPVCYAPAGTWGDVESSIFKKPTAIAIDGENRILVVDESQDKLKIFNREGELLLRGGNAALELSSLVLPAGVAADSAGNIYITDAESHFVIKLDRQGKFAGRWGEFGSDDKGFNSPLGIAVDTHDNVYVVDAGNSRIKKYSAQGQFLKAWGKKGARDGTFDWPRSIAVDPGGNLFVLDSERVQKFSPEGEWLETWNKAGPEETNFNLPQGICVDRNGAVFIADTGNHILKKFDPKGKFLCAWGTMGEGIGMLKSPSGLAVDGLGSVFVVEKENHRVQIFIVASAPGRHAAPSHRPR